MVKTATSIEQSRKLLNAGIPSDTADCVHIETPYSDKKWELYIDAPWVRRNFESYKKIPAWSLSKLVKLLPEALNIAEDEDLGYSIQYDLIIDKNNCKYEDWEHGKLYSTFGLEPIDAVVNMVVLLKQEDMLDKGNEY